MRYALFPCMYRDVYIHVCVRDPTLVSYYIHAYISYYVRNLIPICICRSFYMLYTAMGCNYMYTYHRKSTAARATGVLANLLREQGAMAVGAPRQLRVANAAIRAPPERPIRCDNTYIIYN